MRLTVPRAGLSVIGVATVGLLGRVYRLFIGHHGRAARGVGRGGAGVRGTGTGSPALGISWWPVRVAGPSGAVAVVGARSLF
jgi:hypothetical protein